jgi:hypothetical protein
MKGYSHILIMGDFNYPDIDWENWNTKGDNTNSHEYKFVETIQDNFLYQHTRKPTRRRGTDTPHILDLIVANEETMIHSLSLYSLVLLDGGLYTRPTSSLSVWLSFIYTNRFSWKFVFMCISVAFNLLSKYKKQK